MKLKEAESIFSQIKSSKLTDLLNKLIQSGIMYARIRVDYHLLPIDEKTKMEEERTIAHNAFISSCDILARNMAKQGEDNFWRGLIGIDRKEIWDIACWIHLIIRLIRRQYEGT